jgi:IclR family transcriptional regulator, acetate operon repressor
MTTEQKTAVIQSLQIGLQLLEIIAKENEPLKFTEIQNLTSMTKSNLYKYLATLNQFGAIYRNPHTNTYSLGPKLVQLGSAALSQTSLIEIAIPFFKKINEHTNLTALLAVPTARGPLVSYIMSADYGINIGAQIGTTLPLTSSTGIVFSAFEKAEPMIEWEEIEFKKYSEIELQQIYKEQEEARKTLFAAKTEPLIEHVSSFCVPILNFNDQIVGAITIVGHTEAVPRTLDHQISQYVHDVASQLSNYYGYVKNQ